VGILVILEHPEETVEPDVDTGRLDKTGIIGVDLDPPCVDLGPDITIGKQHVTNLSSGGPPGHVAGVTGTGRRRMGPAVNPSGHRLGVGPGPVHPLGGHLETCRDLPFRPELGLR